MRSVCFVVDGVGVCFLGEDDGVDEDCALYFVLPGLGKRLFTFSKLRLMCLPHFSCAEPFNVLSIWLINL